MIPEAAEVNLKLNQLASDYTRILNRYVGADLVSVVLFGSVARKEAAAMTDVDLLIIVKNLPKGQFARKEQLIEPDEGIAPALEALSEEGIHASFSRILKTPEEASHFIPLYLDLVEDAILLFDRDNFFEIILSGIRDRLKALGARRLSSGRIRYWDLKPDLKPGERFSL